MVDEATAIIIGAVISSVAVIGSAFIASRRARQARVEQSERVFTGVYYTGQVPQTQQMNFSLALAPSRWFLIIILYLVAPAYWILGGLLLFSSKASNPIAGILAIVVGLACLGLGDILRRYILISRRAGGG